MDLNLNHLLGEARPTVRDVETEVLSEKIDVKKVAKLWSRGVLPHEIAEILSMSDVLLDELMRSESFVEEVNALQATKELTSLDKLFESTSAEALVCLRDLMKNSSDDRVRSKIAMYIVDQHRGKAMQRVNIVGGGPPVNDPKSEIERLKTKLGYT